MCGAIKAIEEMIVRSQNAQAKFVQGTAQHTLLENRINALKVALVLIKNKQPSSALIEEVTKEEIQKSVAPITSLIHKSEKAQSKLQQSAWQHAMLGKNIAALYIALQMAEEALNIPNI